ncbi:MAG: aspartyl protease family protein [Chloroflexota bacterium]
MAGTDSEPFAGPEHDGATQLTVTYDVALPYVEGGGRLLPLLRVGLQLANGHFHRVDALVDTGADLSLIEGRIAAAAGLDPTRDFLQTAPIAGVAGSTGLYVFVHRVTLYVGTSASFYAVSTDVGFTDPRVLLTANVLGRSGFLDRVRVGLDDTALPPLLYLGFPS